VILLVLLVSAGNVRACLSLYGRDQYHVAAATTHEYTSLDA